MRTRHPSLRRLSLEALEDRLLFSATPTPSPQHSTTAQHTRPTPADDDDDSSYTDAQDGHGTPTTHPDQTRPRTIEPTSATMASLLSARDSAAEYSRYYPPTPSVAEQALVALLRADLPPAAAQSAPAPSRPA